jgi:ribonuclease HII
VDLWHFERSVAGRNRRRIAGIDEAGRGPLAGPVVSAAVVLPSDFPEVGVQDSKKLTSGRRQQLYHFIYRHALSIGVGIVDPPVIDRINILQASLAAMRMAVANLRPQPDYLLIDGTFPIASNLPQQPIPGGDSCSLSIAAASIVAKVFRDKLMDIYDIYYPQFGFSQHKGYPTPSHKTAIRHFGCCPIHRKTFKGVKEYLHRAPQGFGHGEVVNFTPIETR